MDVGFDSVAVAVLVLPSYSHLPTHFTDYMHEVHQPLRSSDGG